MLALLLAMLVQSTLALTKLFLRHPARALGQIRLF